jgi:Protein of unknown function with PCYCGC motif
MLTGSRRFVVIAACAVVAGVVAYGGLQSLGPAHVLQPVPPAAAAASAPASDPAEQLRITLDPKLFQGDVRKAYEVAERNPALLAQLHCYCGCDRTDGHKNLLDCFRTRHGSTCAICTGEAIEAETLANQGMPVEQIRDALRTRYAHGD